MWVLAKRYLKSFSVKWSMSSANLLYMRQLHKLSDTCLVVMQWVQHVHLYACTNLCNTVKQVRWKMVVALKGGAWFCDWQVISYVCLDSCQFTDKHLVHNWTHLFLCMYVCAHAYTHLGIHLKEHKIIISKSFRKK